MATQNTCDVVVVSRGTAGVIAALQSVRAGVKVLLIEKSEILRGTITKIRKRYRVFFVILKHLTVIMMKNTKQIFNMLEVILS